MGNDSFDAFDGESMNLLCSEGVTTGYIQITATSLIRSIGCAIGIHFV